MSLLRRRSPAAEETPEVVEPEVTATRGYTPGKGRPTPKRSEASKRRGVATAPADKKEAKAQMRAKMRDERSAAYEGMRRGEEKYLPARDKGPARRLVRDLVDARRNVGSYFLIGAFGVLLFSQPQWGHLVNFGANVLWILLIAAILLDVFLISRTIRREVRSRLPKSTEKMGSLTFYGVMRSVQFRRMRSPTPQVKVGDKV